MPAMTEERQEQQISPAARHPATGIRHPATGIGIDPGRLAWWRESRGWSRMDLSRAVASLGLEDEDGGPLTVGRDAIAKIENGERRPKGQTVRALCEAISTPEHPCIPRDLMPGGPQLIPHKDAAARRARLAHNRELRLFARAHGIRYKSEASGRVYYSKPLQNAWYLSVSGADDEAVADAVAAAVAAGTREPPDPPGSEPDEARDQELMAS